MQIVATYFYNIMTAYHIVLLGVASSLGYNVFFDWGGLNFVLNVFGWIAGGMRGDGCCWFTVGLAWLVIDWLFCFSVDRTGMFYAVGNPGWCQLYPFENMSLICFIWGNPIVRLNRMCIWAKVEVSNLFELVCNLYINTKDVIL